jgi:hypothetical protein
MKLLFIISLDNNEHTNEYVYERTVSSMSESMNCHPIYSHAPGSWCHSALSGGEKYLESAEGRMTITAVIMRKDTFVAVNIVKESCAN